MPYLYIVLYITFVFHKLITDRQVNEIQSFTRQIVIVSSRDGSIRVKPGILKMWEMRLYASLVKLQAMSITQLHRMRLVGRTTDAFIAFLTAHRRAYTVASSECSIVVMRNS